MSVTTIGRRVVLGGACGLLAAPAVVRAQGKAGGVALVIGNSKYAWEAQLPNVRRDAPDIAKRFQAFGLNTELVQDAGRDAMNRAFDKFGAAAKSANFAAFYFAGHGASWGKDTYLVPVDADLSTPSTVQTLINSLDVGKATRGAANRLFVYDNCRNNPADGWRQLEAERNAITAYSSEGQRGGYAGAANTLVLFSTAPGHVALDGAAGQNSPFAASLLRQLNDASVDLQSLPSRLRRDLLLATQGRQVMFDRNNFSAPFSVNGSPRPGSAAPGGGFNPANVIELPKAYAYAQENSLPLPSGLIAYRAAGGSRDAQKVGSFQFARKSKLGTDPALLIVMSVEAQQTAEVIMSVKGRFNPKTQKMEGGSIWRYITSRIAGDRLDYVPRDGADHMIFDWHDANSGSFSGLNEDAGAQSKGVSSGIRFTRLDG
jgi:hypothetical protein